jgi:hypothetical protein
MARVAWEFEQGTGRWLGKLGNRQAFVVKPSPDNQAWDILFNWTGVTFEGFPNIASTREPCERKLVLFAEQTGMTLPEDVEAEGEPTLAQDLVEGFKGEMQWFKDADTPERRAEYFATQALQRIERWIRGHRLGVDDEIKDPEYHGAIGVLRDLVEEVWEAQEELGLEVERDWPED